MTPDNAWALAVAGIAFAVYFLPSIVALARGHHNAGAIAVLNVLAGWTMVGWIIALVWAASAVSKTHVKSTAFAVWVLLSSGLACVALLALRTPIASFVRERAAPLFGGELAAEHPKSLSGPRITYLRNFSGGWYFYSDGDFILSSEQVSPGVSMLYDSGHFLVGQVVGNSISCFDAKWSKIVDETDIGRVLMTSPESELAASLTSPADGAKTKPHESVEGAHDRPPDAKSDLDAPPIPNNGSKKSPPIAKPIKPKPEAPSLESQTREKFGPKLAEAKRLIEANDLKAATQILREIVDEAPLTNLAIEARRLLKSLPSDDVKTRSDRTP